MNKELKNKLKEMDQFFGKPPEPQIEAWGYLHEAVHFILSNKLSNKKGFKLIDGIKDINSVKLVDFASFLMFHGLTIKFGKAKK